MTRQSASLLPPSDDDVYYIFLRLSEGNKFKQLI